MPKAKNPKADEAETLYRKGLKLVEIAKQLSLPQGTVRRWKSTYRWDNERSGKAKPNKPSVRKEKKIAKEVKSVLKNNNLTDKQKMFCLHFVKSFNATKAYQKAYECDYRTAGSNGFNLLKNTEIKSEINRLKQAKMNRVFLDESDIFQKYMDIAFSDITDYVEFGQKEIELPEPDSETGEFKKVKVNRVDFKNSNSVDGTLIQEVKQGKDGVSIKLMDRQKALDWIASHMNLATEEQRARIEQIRVQTIKMRGEEESEDIQDDGFIQALSSTAKEDWSDGDD